MEGTYFRVVIFLADGNFWHFLALATLKAYYECSTTPEHEKKRDREREREREAAVERARE